MFMVSFPLLCDRGEFFDLPAWRGGGGGGGWRGWGAWVGKILFHYAGGASEIFDPKVEIYKINYRENKNKINKDTNNVDKTKEII